MQLPVEQQAFFKPVMGGRAHVLEEFRVAESPPWI